MTWPVTVDLVPSASGMHAGYGTVVVKAEKDARKLVELLNGLDLGGQMIELKMVRRHFYYLLFMYFYYLFVGPEY